jgi:hypothetical protein
MALDFLKLLFSYGTALLVVAGGMYILYITRSEPTADNLQLVISGFIGAALTWLFGETTRSSTARQTSRALAITANPTLPPPGEPTS